MTDLSCLIVIVAGNVGHDGSQYRYTTKSHDEIMNNDTIMD